MKWESDESLQAEFEETVQKLKDSGDPQGAAMQSFYAMLMSLLSTGEILDSEQLEVALTRIYSSFMGDRTADAVAIRMDWARQYGWLPWMVSQN